MADSLDDMVEPDRLLPPPENPATQMAGKVRHGLGELTGVNDAYKAVTGQMSETEQQDFAAQAAMGLLPMGKIPAAFIGAVGIRNLAKQGIKEPQLGLKLAEQMEAKGFDRKQIWEATNLYKDVDGKWRYEISDQGLKVQEGIGYTGLRDSPIQHPELERAYPKVPFVSDVYVDPKMGARRGRYARDEGEIPEIMVKGPTLGDARSTASHELQHLISDIEDFAAGGSFAEMKEMAQSALPKGKVSTSLQKKADDAAWEAYRLHSGEVEARNVQTRLDMSDQARKRIPPWRTQDVDDKDKIVRKFPKGLSESVEKLDKISGDFLNYKATDLEYMIKHKANIEQIMADVQSMRHHDPKLADKIMKGQQDTIAKLDHMIRNRHDSSKGSVVIDNAAVNQQPAGFKQIAEIVKKYGLAGTMMLPAATANLLREKLIPVDHDPFAQVPANAD